LPAAHEWDPWVSLGTGWRGYWIHANQNETSMHGWEIAKVELGVDYRIAPTVAISPVVGADLSTFFTESTPQSNGYQNLSSPSVNTFVFARFCSRAGPARAFVGRVGPVASHVRLSDRTSGSVCGTGSNVSLVGSSISLVRRPARQTRASVTSTRALVTLTGRPVPLTNAVVSVDRSTRDV
jgi:hypothetical protein